MTNASPYLHRIHAARPDLDMRDVQVNHDGLVNDVVIVNGAWVFRFPKDETATRDLLHEVRVIELARHHVDLALPVFHLHEAQTAPFVSYPYMPGVALHREDILLQDDTTQERLAEQVGVFLRQLHSIPIKVVQQQGIGTSGAARTREDWLRFYADLEYELFPLLMAHAREWVQGLFAPLLDGRLSLAHQPALIHGDLGPYHLLYDPLVRQVSGVIDFGMAGLGDPAVDFANIIHGLGESFLRRMLPYHPGITSALDRARFHAGTLELQWALHGLRSGDHSWFVCHIGRARDVWPVTCPTT